MDFLASCRLSVSNSEVGGRRRRLVVHSHKRPALLQLRLNIRCNTLLLAVVLSSDIFDILTL